MVDDSDDQRISLHNAPQPAARQPPPGELLMKFEHGQDVDRVELRDFDPYGVEGQIFQNGILLEGTRFSVRALAERMGRAEARGDSQGGCVVTGGLSRTNGTTRDI